MYLLVKSQGKHIDVRRPIILRFIVKHLQALKSKQNPRQTVWSHVTQAAPPDVAFRISKPGDNPRSHSHEDVGGARYGGRSQLSLRVVYLLLLLTV